MGFPRVLKRHPLSCALNHILMVMDLEVVPYVARMSITRKEYS